jgi:hypothetical protein
MWEHVLGKEHELGKIGISILDSSICKGNDYLCVILRLILKFWYVFHVSYYACSIWFDLLEKQSLQGM